MSAWPVFKLGEIFDIARGGSPRPIDKFITDAPEGINWVMISDATASTKFITKTKKKITQEGVARSRLVNSGDFLLTNSMSFGHPYIMATSGCIHDGWLVLSPKSNNINQDYFYHLLGSDTVYAEFERRAAGATVKNINIDIVKNVQVALPPLPEQKRIAAILDQADALRRLRQRAIDRLNTLGQAIFYEMFGDPVTNPKGWDMVMLGTICGVGSSKRVFVNEFVDEGVPFYRGTEVGKLGAGEDIDPDLFIAPNHYDELINHSGKPEIGDLLLPSICHDGRIWRVDNEEPFYFKDGRVLWIKKNESRINSEYLRIHLRKIYSCKITHP